MRELLGELGIESQLLIVNGHLPESVCEDPFFEEKRADEQAAIERARTEFDADAMATHPLQPGEVSGLDLLEDVGGVLYDGDEATVEVGTATDVDAETAVDFESMTDADAIADQLQWVTRHGTSSSPGRAASARVRSSVLPNTTA